MMVHALDTRHLFTSHYVSSAIARVSEAVPVPPAACNSVSMDSAGRIVKRSSWGDVPCPETELSSPHAR
eukprot:5587661-Amphidinium_carterae.1